MKAFVRKAFVRTELVTNAERGRAVWGTFERLVRVAALSVFAVVAAKVGGEKPDRGGGAGEGETNRVERVEDAGESDRAARPAPPQSGDKGGAPEARAQSTGDSPHFPSGDSPQFSSGDSPRLLANVSADGLRQTQKPRHPITQTPPQTPPRAAGRRAFCRP